MANKNYDLAHTKWMCKYHIVFGVAVIITYSPQNGVILLVMAFLISPMGLPLAAGKGTEFEICNSGQSVRVNVSCS